jgi:hypothetical protein
MSSEEEEAKVKVEESEEIDQKGTKRQKTDANTGESDENGEVGGGGDGDDDDENDSFKIKSRREANRLHALKSRQRSKQLLSDLQTTVGQLKSDKQDLERQNSVLLAQVDVLQQQNYKLLQGQQMLLAQNPSMAAPSSMGQNQSMAATPSSMAGGLSSSAYSGLQQQPGMQGFMQQHLMGGGSDSSMQGMFPQQQQLQMAQLQHFQQQQLQQQQLQQQMMNGGQQSQMPGQSMMSSMNGQQSLLDRQSGSAAKES